MLGLVPPGTPRRVVVIDDDRFTCDLVARHFDTIGFDVTQANSAAEAVAQIDETDPDVALVDLDLGEGPTGADVIRHIQKHAPWIAIIVLSSHRSLAMVGANMAAPSQNFVHLVKSDLSSVRTLEQAVTEALEDVEQAQPDCTFPRLTRAQASLLALIAQGMSNQEIAERRNVSLKAIERMVARLYRTLEVPTRPSGNPRVEATRIYLSGSVTSA